MIGAVPAFPSASLNVRGFHNYGRGQDSLKKAKQRTATALALKHDITYFQETNLNARENKF